MCFHISRQTGFINVKTAKNDIKCFKVLCKGNISAYRRYRYNLNKTTTFSVKEFGFLCGKTEIHQGFHSYSEKGKAMRNKQSYQKIVNFIIPKGTKYFHNPIDREYVSLSLKYVKPRPKTVKPVTKKAKPSKTKTKKRK